MAREVRACLDRDARDVLAEGVRAVDAVVSGPVRVLHVRDGAAPHRLAVTCRRTRWWRSPRRARRRGATRRCSPSVRPRRTGTSKRATGWPPTATPRRSTTWCDGGAGAGGDRSAAPRERRRRLPRRAGPTADRRAVPGDDDRVAASRPGRAPRRPGQDPGTPAGDAARRPGSSRIPFTTGILVGIGETEADRLEALRGHRRGPSPARARAGGDRAELPAQAGHRDARPRRPARPRTTCGRSRWPGWCCRPTCTSRRRRTSPTRAARRPAGRRDRRLGRGLPGHHRPRQPRTPLARRRHVARGHRGAAAWRWHHG